MCVAGEVVHDVKTDMELVSEITLGSGLVADAGDDAAGDEVTASISATAEQPSPGDTVALAELQKLSDGEEDGAQLQAAADDGGKDDDDDDDEASSVVEARHGSADSKLSDDHSEQKMDEDQSTDNIEPDHVEKVTTDVSETQSAEMQSGTSANLPEARSDCGTAGSQIDWDALGKPKQRSSVGDNAEFSQIFNKVVKQRSEAESNDSRRVTAERSFSSPCERSADNRVKFVKHLPLKSLKSSGKSEHEAGKVEQRETVELSTTSKTDKTIDKETVTVDVPDTDRSSEPSTVASPSTSHSSAADQVSSAVSESKREYTKQTSPVKYHIETGRAKFQNENIKASAPSQESSSVVKEDAVLSSPGIEPSTPIKSEPLGKDTVAKSADRETDPCADDTVLPSLTKEVTQSTSPALKVKLPTASESRQSPSKKSSESEPRGKNVDAKQERQDSTESETKSAGRPLIAKKNATPTKTTQSPPSQRVQDSGSAMSSPKSEAHATPSHPESPESHNSVTRSSSAGKSSPVKKQSSSRLKEQPSSDSTVSDSSQFGTPIKTRHQHDSECDGCAEKQPGDITGAGLSRNAKQEDPVCESDRNLAEAETGAKTSSSDHYVAKTVSAQQKKAVQRRPVAKVQPSEAKSEEPAWIVTAKRRSTQWSEDRTEELERKLPKDGTAVDTEVRSC